jgi:hypothetical protein
MSMATRLSGTVLVPEASAFSILTVLYSLLKAFCKAKISEAALRALLGRTIAIEREGPNIPSNAGFMVAGAPAEPSGI